MQEQIYDELPGAKALIDLAKGLDQQSHFSSRWVIEVLDILQSQKVTKYRVLDRMFE
jgi:hypothetical protein